MIWWAAPWSGDVPITVRVFLAVPHLPETPGLSRGESEKPRHHGSGWESNPPGTLAQNPTDGFEDRGAHRDSTTPKSPYDTLIGRSGQVLVGHARATTSYYGKFRAYREGQKGPFLPVRVAFHGFGRQILLPFTAGPGGYSQTTGLTAQLAAVICWPADLDAIALRSRKPSLDARP